MANEKHLYLTIQGGYKAAPLNTEIWQTGVRLALVFGTIDDIGTLPNNWEPTANPHTDSDSGWTGSTNWVATGPGGEDFDPLDFLSQQVFPAVASWLSQNYISQEAYVANLRMYPIGDDGTAVPAPPYAVGTPAILTTTSNTVLDGSGTTTILPTQISVVQSLRTPQIGRKGRGRMFQPAMTAATMTGTADPTIGSTARTNMATSTATLMSALTWEAGVGVATVAPIVTGRPWVDYARVTSVRVGSIPDTQRRRRNALVEAFTSVDV